jgi:hypothetical protein
MLVVFVAWAMTRLPPRIQTLLCASVATVTVMSLFFYYQYAEFPRPPFRDASAFLTAQVSDGDAIIHDNKLSYFPTHYYAPTLPEAFVADPVGAASDTLALPTQAALQLFATSLDAATQGHARVWFVIFREARDQTEHPANLEWLNEHYRQIQTVSFNDLDIYLYEK